MSSIRRIIPIVLSLQITIAVGITWWISFNSSEKAIQKLTKQLCLNLNYRVEQQIFGLFSDVARLNKSVIIAFENGYINSTDINQGVQYLFRKAKGFDIKYEFFYGNENGTFAGIDRNEQDRSKFILRIKEDANKSNRSTFELNNNGERGKYIPNTYETKYEVTQRPWYIAAKNAGKETWSSIFVSSINGELNITKAEPFYNLKGDLQGVAGVSLSISDIKNFMIKVLPNDKWTIFLVEDNGNLVATTSKAPVFEKNDSQIKRLQVFESKDDRLQKAGLSVQNQLGGFRNLQDLQIFEFESNGEKYIISMHKLDRDLQLGWSVGIVVPKAIFMEEIDANNRFTLIVVVIVLGINILVGLIISAWLLHPIKNLMTAAKEIEADSFNPEGLATITNRNDELGQMARVFQEMGSTITDRSQGMKRQLNKLREENDEAKKAAISSSAGQSNSLQSILSRSKAARSK